MTYDACEDCKEEKTGRQQLSARCRSCAGKNISPETRAQMRLGALSNTNAVGNKNFLGKTHSLEARQAMSLARGGDGIFEGHHYPRLGRWTSLVKERDGYKCIQCDYQGAKGDNFMEAHHVVPKAKFPELATELFNGVTYCRPCHKEIHAT